MLLAFFYCSLNMCGSGYLFWSEEMGIFSIFGGGLLLRRKQISAAAASNPEKM